MAASPVDRRNPVENSPPLERRGASHDRREEDRRQSERRGGDRRVGERRQSRSRELLNKYRQPIIGLGLAGAAVPLVNARNAVEDETTGRDVASNPAAPQLAAEQAAAAATGADTEDQLAARIGASRAEDARQTKIKAAMAQFDISEALASDIYDIAEQENIDPEVAYGLVRTESTFNEKAVSHVGARGLTQVMPRTARGIIPGTSAEQLFDRKTNLRLGFRYLDQLIQKYRGNMDLALTAYNRGPGTVDKVLKRGGDPDNGYAGKVLRGS